MAEFRRGAAAGVKNALVLHCPHLDIEESWSTWDAFHRQRNAVEAGHASLTAAAGQRDGPNRALAALTSNASLARRAGEPTPLGVGLANILVPDRIVLTRLLPHPLETERQRIDARLRERSGFVRRTRAELVRACWSIRR
jgi:hypothetical protein